MLTCYADILLEKGHIKADEIWDIYKSAPRVAQVDLDKSGAYSLFCQLPSFDIVVLL